VIVRADNLEEGERKEKEGKERHEKKDKEASDLLPHLVAPLMNHSALSVGSHGTPTDEQSDKRMRFNTRSEAVDPCLTTADPLRL
jgi:hypothetical protein